jgi:nucleoside-diphosphate kinase
MEKLIILAKPDAVRRGLQDHIKQTYQNAGFELRREETYSYVTEELAEPEEPDLRYEDFMRFEGNSMLAHCSYRLFEQHYAEHKGKPFYDNLMLQMKGGTVVAYLFVFDSKVLSIEIARQICMQLRDEISQGGANNSVHCSDSIASAKREHDIWFNYNV